MMLAVVLFIALVPFSVMVLLKEHSLAIICKNSNEEFVQGRAGRCGMGRAQGQECGIRLSLVGFSSSRY